MLIWWTEKLATGIKSIDEEHKEIIDMLNHLHEAMTKKDAKEDISLVLTALAVYVRKHFAAEEAVMAKIGFPYLERQKKAHRALVQKVQSLLQKHQRGDTPSIREMVAFLKDWLMNHIEKEDLKIGDYYRVKQDAVKQKAALSQTAKKAATKPTTTKAETSASETASQSEATAESGDQESSRSESKPPQAEQAETVREEVAPQETEQQPGQENQQQDKTPA